MAPRPVELTGRPDDEPAPKAHAGRTRSSGGAFHIIWDLGAATLVGLTVALIAAAIVIGQAHGAELQNDARSAQPGDHSWEALTAGAPFLEPLLATVWAAAGSATFLLLTRDLWRR